MKKVIVSLFATLAVAGGVLLLRKRLWSNQESDDTLLEVPTDNKNSKGAPVTA